MAGAKKLVIGASGFLGSHVTRQLVDRGDDVRVLIRRTSSTKPIEDLDVEYHYGDIFDDAALRAAMAGCDDVFYCVVDTRAWLRDPAPLFRTNVEGLRHVLDAAMDAISGASSSPARSAPSACPPTGGRRPKRTSSIGRTRPAPTCGRGSRRRTS
jgi:nucleoside-diphosphate-sugar epimerase